MTSLYTVKALAGHDWASTNTSVVLTTLDREKAIEFADTYEKENHLIAIAVSGYDHFDVQVFEHELEKECTEVLIYQTTKWDGFKVLDTSFPRLFSEQYIEEELKHFYNRRGSVSPKIVNVTIGDAINGNVIEPVASELTKEQFLGYIRKQIEIDMSYVTYENRIYSAKPTPEKIDDAMDWDLYNSFERQHH